MCSWGYGELALRHMSHGSLRYLARDSYLKGGSFERLQEQISWANEDRCKRSIEMIANHMVSSDLHSPIIPIALSFVVTREVSFVYTAAALLISFWSKFGKSCVT